MSTFQVISAVVCLVAVFGYVNHRFVRLPDAIGITAIGVLVSIGAIVLARFDAAVATEMRVAVDRIDFPEILLHGVLGLLLFAGSLHIDINDVAKEKWLILSLATFGVVASTALVGLGFFAVTHGIGMAIPWLYCLLFGALISPTDPVAVLAVIKRVGVPKSLEVRIAGESLFNDGVGVVIFVLLVGIATQGGTPTIGEASMLLLQEAGGGLAFGALLGFGLYYLLRTVDDYKVEALLTLAAVLGGYTLANHLHTSGPLAMVVTGLVIGNNGRAEAMSDVTRHHIDLFWELLDEILNAVLFVLVGLQVITLHFPVSGFYAIAAGAMAIVVTLFARWLTVGVPTIAFHKVMRLPRGSATILTWGGLRGGISIALALAVPAGHQQQTLVALTYCVVAFSILVQGLTFGRLVKRWIA